MTAPIAPWAFDLTLAASALAGIVGVARGVRRHRPRNRRAWGVLVAALGLLTTALALRAILAFVGSSHQEHPLLELAFLGGDLLAVGAFVWLLRKRMQIGQREAAWDASVITLAIGMVSFERLASSAVTDGLIAPLVSAGMLAAQLTFFALALRVTFARPPGARAVHLLLATAGAGVIHVLALFLGSGGTAWGRSPAFALSAAVALSLPGLVALHPSMRLLGEPVEMQSDKEVRSRLRVLGAVTYLAPVTAMAPHWSGGTWVGVLVAALYGALVIAGVKRVTLVVGERDAAAARLRERETFVSGVLDSLSERVATFDSGGTSIGENVAWARDAEQPALRRWQRAQVEEVLGGVLPTSAESYDKSCRVGEHERYFSVRATALPAEHGFMISYADVTRRQIAEQELRRRLTQQKAIASFAREIPQTDSERLHHRALRALRDGLPDAETALYRRSDNGALRRWDSEHAADPWPLGEVVTCAADRAFAVGRAILVDPSHPSASCAGCSHRSALAAPFRHGTGAGLLLASSRAVHDFTEEDVAFVETVAGTLTAALSHAATQMSLHRQANTDQTTLLPNRRALNREAERLLVEGSPGQIGLLLISIHDLQLVVETYGHKDGDVLLLAVIDRLKQQLRSTDFLASLGGSNLAVLCRGLAGTQALDDVAARLRVGLSHAFEVRGSRVYAHATIGSARGEADVDYQELLRRSAVALDAAHEAGGNNLVHYSPSLDTKAHNRLEIAADLHRAIDTGQFELHYQPQLQIDSGHIVSIEALTRWRHPDRGVLAPPAFFAEAEESGLIEHIDAEAIHGACRQLADWRAAGLDVPRVSVNVSSSTLHGDALVDHVEEALSASGLEPHRLELELTEHSVMQQPEGARRTLQRLRSLGVRLAVDDFGVGQSSLGHLQQFSFDTLKIDQTFMRAVTDLTTARRSEVAVIRALVALAEHLSLDLVVAGIETALQRDLIRHLGCRLAQGNLYCPTLPPADLEPLLSALRGRLGTTPTTVAPKASR